MGLRSILSQSHGSMLARYRYGGEKEKRPDKRTESHGAVGRKLRHFFQWLNPTSNGVDGIRSIMSPLSILADDKTTKTVANLDADH
jgi:hypothetical protein